jgi:hypothetical protein
MASQELIQNPLSQDLRKIMTERQEHYDSYLKRRGLRHVADMVKVRLWYLEKHDELLAKVREFSIARGIQGLFRQFDEVADRIAFNNLLMAYGYLVEGKPMVPLLLKEEEKNLLLAAVDSGDATLEEFRNMFGHYADDTYDLAQQRYGELPDSDLLALARLCSGFRVNSKIGYDEYRARHPSLRYPIYAYIREEQRSCMLKVLAGLRKEMLGLAKEQQTANFFGLDRSGVLAYADKG